MKIFITGGCGFIGHHATRMFLSQGHEVVLYDNLRRNAIQYTDLLKHPRLRFVQGDILDAARLKRAMHGCSVVIHLAAMAGVSSYYFFPRRTMEVNVLGLFNVLEAVRDMRLRLFISYSTSEVYGPSVFRSDEDEMTAQGAAKDPRWSYAVSKLAGEHLCFAYAREYKKFPFVTIRPFNVYGPGQVGEGAVSLFIDRALSGKPLRVTGDGTQIRAWCYIDDMLKALDACVRRAPRVKGNIFNIGNPSGTTTILDLVHRIHRLTESRSKIVHVPHIGTDVDLRVPNIRKARRMLGFRPTISVDEGLRRTIEWHRATHPEIKEF